MYFIINIYIYIAYNVKILKEQGLIVKSHLKLNINKKKTRLVI